MKGWSFMNNEMKIREEVYNKMESEYQNFINNLKEKTPDEIVDKSYEITIKEELLYDFQPEYEFYNIEKIRALNKSKAPLEELYQGWLSYDTNIHEVLEYSTNYTLDKLVIYQKEKSKQIER